MKELAKRTILEKLRKTGRRHRVLNEKLPRIDLTAAPNTCDGPDVGASYRENFGEKSTLNDVELTFNASLSNEFKAQTKNGEVAPDASYRLTTTMTVQAYG